MKKRTNLKLNFKKERIAKLNKLHMIKGGTNTVEETHKVTTCVPTLSANC